MPEVRAARLEEAERLSALCWRSKGFWGYDAAFMARCRDALTVRADAIAASRVWVSVDNADAPLGVAQIERAGELIDLDKLFVDPRCLGQGVGRALFTTVARAGRALGFREMSILADPHAAPFYERMGARFVRMAPSDSIPGRELPLYLFRL